MRDRSGPSNECLLPGVWRGRGQSRDRPSQTLLQSQIPGSWSSTATVTAGDVVVSGKVDRGTLHYTTTQGCVRTAVRGSPASSTRATTLGWISMRPRAVMEISGHLTKTRSASGTGTTLLVDSYLSCYTATQAGRHQCMVQCRCHPGLPGQFPVRSTPTSGLPDLRGSRQDDMATKESHTYSSTINI